MKKFLSYIAFAMMAVFSLAFVSCSDDDDDNSDSQKSEKTIEINGKQYEITSIIEWEGSWNEQGDNKGLFYVSVYNQVHNTKDVWAYQFEYTATRLPEIGDDFAKMSLTLFPADGHTTGIVYGDFTYQSGAAQVININKEKDYITVKFDKLTMSGIDDDGKNCTYVFNGTADISFNFYR